MKLRFKLVDDDIDNQDIEESQYKFDVIGGSFSLGSVVTVELGDKQYTRRVYDDPMCGLYIRINGNKYFEYEGDYSKYYDNKNKDN